MSDNINNDYYSIAFNDYMFLKSNMGKGFYNQTLPLIQQIGEKLLKSVLIDLSLIDPEDKIMRSRKLDRLYDNIQTSNNTVVQQYRLNVRDLSWLTGFYFDCKYPGDNFIVATKQQEEEAHEILQEIFNYVNNIRKDYSEFNITITQPTIFGEN